MSSAVVSTSAALGRPFVFDDDAEPEVGSLQGSCGGVEGSGRAKLDANNRPAAKILPSSVVPASRLSIRPAPEMVSSGIHALDALTGGLPRGCLTEICGPASSGRTSLLLAALAAATRRGEFCAIIDASDTLDPHSAAAAGVDLDRLLWVRCSDDPPKKENSPQRHRVTEKQQKKEEENGSSILAAPFAAGTGMARVGRLRPDRPRSRRPADASCAPHPVDHLVPLPPRSREQTHNPVSDRATSHRRKLLVAAAAVGTREQRIRSSTKQFVRYRCPSREAAKKCSPWRKPWVKHRKRASPGGAKEN